MLASAKQRRDEASHAVPSQSQHCRSPVLAGDLDELSLAIARAIQSIPLDAQAALLLDIGSILGRAPLRHKRKGQRRNNPRNDFLQGISGERIVRPEEFQARAGLKPTQFFELQRRESRFFDESFPERVLINPGGRAVGYLESSVQIWIQQRPKKAKERKNDQRK